MKFIEISLQGVFLIEIEKIEDERGFFARTWDKKVFEERGLDSKIMQCSVSFSTKKGTIRGMHYQIEPFEETKLVKCTRGRIYDVIIDLRANSETFKEWYAVELSALNHRILYIPKGFAHGFQTLEDNTETCYEISQIFSPDHARGIRWDDPVFNIKWPLSVSTISQKDRSYE